MDISTLYNIIENIRGTSQYVPIFGYMVLYDKGQYAFGKVTHVGSHRRLAEPFTKFLMPFCINHDLTRTRPFCVPSCVEVTICERHKEIEPLLMAMVVRNLSRLRKEKRRLSILSYLVINLDEKLERYEAYYRELTKIEELSSRTEK